MASKKRDRCGGVEDERGDEEARGRVFAMADAEERLERHGGGEQREGLTLRLVDAAWSRLNRYGTLLLYTAVAIVDGRDPLRVP